MATWCWIDARVRGIIGIMTQHSTTKHRRGCNHIDSYWVLAVSTCPISHSSFINSLYELFLCRHDVDTGALHYMHAGPDMSADSITLNVTAGDAHQSIVLPIAVVKNLVAFLLYLYIFNNI